MVSFIVLHGLKMRLHLWARGGRAAPAVEAHSCRAYPLLERRCCQVAWWDVRVTACNPVGESIGSARRWELLTIGILEY